MGQILHGSATTNEAVRRAIQNSQASLRALAGRYGINPKTVAKWRGRTSVCDAPMRPKEPRSTVFSKEEEAPPFANIRCCRSQRPRSGPSCRLTRK
jgi:transposase-like protein